jgi:3-dehydroquinate synthase
MPSVAVRLAERSYDITVSPGGLGHISNLVHPKAGRLAVIVTDDNIASHARAVASVLHSAGLQTDVISLTPGEEQKSLSVAAQVYDRLAELHADRTTLVVAVGGGVVGDLAGFVAATFNRGLPLFMVPTTLLAMVDSSVGGKVGVNHPRGKNLIGAFHQPVGVLIDPTVLSTLPEREYRSGLAEVVKYGVTLDSEFFCWLEDHVAAVLSRESAALEHVVVRCCQLKADVVHEDEREVTGRRAILNYGHTFAHAFETVGGYGQWLHGEAVAAGMMCAGLLAKRLHGPTTQELVRRQGKLLQAFGLPIAPERWPIDNLLAAMHSDKKAQGGKLRFVLSFRLGQAGVVDDVSEPDVAAVLEEAMRGSHDAE